MEKTLPPPAGWAEDSLTEFMEAAHRNRFATFNNKKNWSEKLIALDECFMRVATNWTDPPDILIFFLFLRCHSAYRAACEHAMAGQVTDTFPLLRACLEYAGYALHIHENPELGETWLKRHDDDAMMRKVKQNFTVAKVRGTIENVSPDSARIFSELYERAIDFGGHPNERAITGSMTMKEFTDRKLFESIYLHGDGLTLDHALKSTAQTATCALEIFQAVYPERYDVLGVASSLLELRKGL